MREADGKVPGYTRGSINGELSVPSLDLLKTAVELLIGPPVALSAETAVKWLQKSRRGERLASPRIRTSSWGCPSSVLQQIPDAEREVMRADSARNLQLIRELGARQIPTRAIEPSDDVKLQAWLDQEVKRQLEQERVGGE
jgi:hypothetical protein